MDTKHNKYAGYNPDGEEGGADGIREVYHTYLSTYYWDAFNPNPTTATGGSVEYKDIFNKDVTVAHAYPKQGYYEYTNNEIIYWPTSIFA